MKEYTVKYGQNIFDIALQLTGSVEGIYDLIISNPSINVNTELEANQVLLYHEDFIINKELVNYFADNNLIVKNGNPYYEPFNPQDKTCSILIKHTGESSIIAGETTDSFLVDWGDTTTPATCTGSFQLAHGYKDTGKHIIKIYGLNNATSLDFSKCAGDVYPIEQITCNNVTSPDNKTIFKELIKNQ